MLEKVYQCQFIRDLKKSEKQDKDLSKLKVIIELLLQEQPLPQKNKNHKLHGEFVGHWECHIEPDWLLIYRKNL